MEINLKSEKLKALVNKFTLSNSEEERDDYFEKIAECVEDSFNNEKFQQTEALLGEYLDTENTDSFDVLLEAVLAVVENKEITVDNKQYESTMQLLPFTYICVDKGAELPSINQLEEILRLKLLNKKIIEHVKQFHLATVRLTRESVSEMTMGDWWKMHNDAVNEIMSSGKKNNESLRNINTPIEHTGLSAFYLVPIFINRDYNSNILGELYDSVSDINFWNNILKGEWSKDVTISILPPTSITEAIENTEFVIQGVEFESFFNEYSKQKNLEVAYAYNKDKIDEIVVLFFDSEEKTLLQYFKYDTVGDSFSFVKLLAESCLSVKNLNLYRIERALTEKELIEWSEGILEPDLTEILEESHQVDLRETKRLCDIGSYSLDSSLTYSQIH